MSQASELDWLLDDLVARVVHISKAVILSRDGLAIGASAGLARRTRTTSRRPRRDSRAWPGASGRHFGGGPARQIIIEMESEFLFVTAAGEGSCLAVLSAASADVGPRRL